MSKMLYNKCFLYSMHSTQLTESLNYDLVVKSPIQIKREMSKMLYKKCFFYSMSSIQLSESLNYDLKSHLNPI